MVASLLHLILTLATQAAMKESLDAPQPAMADEDDPLLAEAIRASLVETEGGAEGGAEGATDAVEPPLIQRFPALKAQLEAEQRAAGGIGAGMTGMTEDGVDADAAMAAAMAAAAGFDFEEDGAFGDGRDRGWQPPAPPSPATLEARRVREEQDAVSFCIFGDFIPD